MWLMLDLSKWNFVKLDIKCPNSLFCSDAYTCKVPHYYGIADSCFKPAMDIMMSSDQFMDCKLCHIIPVRRVECNNVLFPITSVEALCVLVDCSHSQCMFVCKLPNRYEKDWTFMKSNNYSDSRDRNWLLICSCILKGTQVWSALCLLVSCIMVSLLIVKIEKKENINKWSE